MGAAPRVHDVDQTTTLSERDRKILDFEHQWWKYAGSKEQAVKDRFDLSPEEAQDAAYRIMLSMVQLEELRDEILYGPITENTMIPLPGRPPVFPSVCVQPGPGAAP